MKSLFLAFLTICLSVPVGCSAGTEEQVGFAIIANHNDFGQIVNEGFVGDNSERIYWLSKKSDGYYLYIYDVETGKSQEVLHKFGSQVGEIQGASLSPDGKRMSYVIARNLYVADIEKAIVRKLTDDGKIARGPIWIDNSNFVPEVFENSGAQSSLQLVNMDSSAQKTLLQPAKTSAIICGYAFGATRLVYELVDENVLSPRAYFASLKDGVLGATSPINMPSVLTEGISSVTADGKYATLVGMKNLGDTREVYVGNIEKGIWASMGRSSVWKDFIALISPDGKRLLLVSVQSGKDTGMPDLRLVNVPASFLETLK